MYTVKLVFETISEIGTQWELSLIKDTDTSVPPPIQYVEMDLRNVTTSECRTGVPIPGLECP